MSQGMSGTLRLTAIIATVLLGGLAMLVVLDIVPREFLQDWSVKLVMVVGILAVVTLLVALLSRKD